MGRSRGGLTSKIHALVDADGRPVALRLTGGQVHDSQEAEALLEALPEGATLLADKGYDSNAIREAAARKNAWANIPSRSMILVRVLDLKFLHKRAAIMIGTSNPPH